MVVTPESGPNNLWSCLAPSLWTCSSPFTFVAKYGSNAAAVEFRIQVSYRYVPRLSVNSYGDQGVGCLCSFQVRSWLKLIPGYLAHSM